jgi:hypothetical protein
VGPLKVKTPAVMEKSGIFWLSVNVGCVYARNMHVVIMEG